MRRKVICVAAIAAMVPASALAQSGPRPLAGSIDFGIRATDVSGDPARFQHFRDVGDGLFAERLRLERIGDGWRFEAVADHMGRKDQRYSIDYRGGGRLRLFFTWDQIPLFNSADTRTPYAVEKPGVFRLSDTIQQGIEANVLTRADLAAAARPFDIRSRRDSAVLNVAYAASRELDLHVNFRTSHREGSMPLGATFGMSNYVEVPAPIDTRTTDLNADAEWTSERAMFRVAYDGSWFDNNVPALIWDNPLRLSATATLPSEGRYALWPASTVHAITTAAAVTLPARTRLTGHVSAGSWRQDEPLLPFTINPLVAQPALERATAEGEARTLAMNYTATSRPVRYVWLNARFRYYDFDNRTPEFHSAGYVRYDSTVNATLPHSRPLGYTRNNVDLDASFTPIPFTALRVGYGREWVDRTYRIFERTTDNVLRASIDSTRAGWFTVRAIFERSAREGSGFDEEHLTEAGEQPLMRHFDIADRDRSRVTGLLQITPWPAFGFSASAAVGKDDYENSGLGLRDSETRSYSVSADLTPGERVAAALSYTTDRYSALQRSRAASSAADMLNPLRNWSLDNEDRVHTIDGSIDLLRLVDKTDLRLGYVFSRSKATYVHTVAEGWPLATPQVLPPVEHELHTGTADLRYALTARLTLGAVYWFDRYQVGDFALGTGTMNRLDLPSSLFLGYVFRPYTAHSGWLRLTYVW